MRRKVPWGSKGGNFPIIGDVSPTEKPYTGIHLRKKMCMHTQEGSGFNQMWEMKQSNWPEKKRPRRPAPIMTD